MRPADRAGAPVVVKLGGSLFGGDGSAGRAWLDIVVRAAAPVVVVPGGGSFADAVRREQQRLGLSDPAAHRMALLAMHQTALAVVDMQPEPRRLIVTDSTRGIGEALSRWRVPVWVPLPMTDRDSDIPEDWSITSDGLAAWLAIRIRARHVALVKSCAVPSDATAAELADAGLVDRWFARRVAVGTIPWGVLGPGDTARLAALTGGEMQPGSGATSVGKVRRR